MISEKGAEAKQWCKDSFSTNGAGLTRHPHIKNWKKPTLQKSTQNALDLNVKCESIKII